MKKLSLFCLAACLTLCTSAQKVYFLYLQSEDQSPFYVRTGDKIHSSANSGFLILPNLAAGIYTFGLGFAKSTAPEVKFSVSINEDDKGYIIKKFEDDLSLFDFRDMSLVKSNAGPQDNTVYETKKDNFSSILSKAADDPSLLKVPVVKKEEPPKEKSKQVEVIIAKTEEKAPEKPAETTTTASIPSEETKEQVKKESASTMSPSNTESVKESPATITTPSPAEMKAETTLQNVAAKPSVVRRYSESSTTEGFGIIYFDSWQETVDTIRILIPSSKVKLVAETETGASAEIQPLIEKHDQPKEDTKAVASTSTFKEEPIKAPKATSCKNLASEKDFLKLRKRMAAKDYEDAMLEEARKEFKGKCYTVEQLRYLSTLFLTSASKYQFFDAAYEYAVDKGNFASLGSEIRDEHYTKRFKALIGE